MATSRDRILKELENHPEGLCDDCCSEASAVTPRQSVNQICRPLALQRVINRPTRRCSMCGKLKIVNIRSDGIPQPTRSEPIPHDESRGMTEDQVKMAVMRWLGG